MRLPYQKFSGVGTCFIRIIYSGFESDLGFFSGQRYEGASGGLIRACVNSVKIVEHPIFNNVGISIKGIAICLFTQYWDLPQHPSCLQGDLFM